MVFIPKTWHNDASGATRLNATGLNDLESRIDAGIAAAGGGDTVLCAEPTGVAATDNANFQAGLTAAAGGTLLLRDGTYNLTTAKTVASFTTILGDRATVVNCTVAGAFFDFTGLNGIKFSGGKYNVLGTTMTLFKMAGVFHCVFDNVQIFGTHTVGSPQPGQIGFDFTANAGDTRIVNGSILENLGIGIKFGSFANYLIGSAIINCQYGMVAADSYASGFIITASTLASTPGGTTISQLYVPTRAGYVLVSNTDMEGATNTVVIGSGTLFVGPTHFGMSNCHLAGTSKILDIEASYGTTLSSISFTADPGTTPTTLTINPVGAPDNGFAAGLVTNVLADADTIPVGVFPPAWTYFGRTQSQWPGLSSIASNTWSPTDHGLIAWSYDPSLVSSATILGVAGTIYTVRLKLLAAASVTNVCLYTTTSATLTAGQCFAAIFQGGSLIGVTADLSAVWNTSGFKKSPLVGGPFPVAAGDVIVAFFANGATLPTFARAALLGIGNVNLALANPRYGSDTVNLGNTTSMPGTLGTLGAQSADYWAAIA